MPRREKEIKKPVWAPSPGELYSRIEVSRDIFLKPDEALKKIIEPPYVRLMKRVARIAPALGKGTSYSEEYSHAIQFLGWNLKAEEYNAAVRILLFAAVIAGFAVSLALVNVFSKVVSDVALIGYFLYL